MHELSSTPGFRPHDATMHLVVDELADDATKEDIRLAQNRQRMAGVGGRILRLLRAMNVDCYWWAIATLNRYAAAAAVGDPDPDLADIAMFCHLRKRDLEDLGNRATIDSAAVLYVFLPEKALRDLGVPITASVRKRAHEIRRQSEAVAKRLGAYRGLPWFDPELARLEREAKR